MRHSGVPPGPGELANGQPRRRIPVACARCRKRKIKCSGALQDGACQSCRQSGADQSQCRFDRVHSRGIDWEPVENIPSAPSYAVNQSNPSPPLPVVDHGSLSANSVQARRSNASNLGQRQSVTSAGPFGYDNVGLEPYGHQTPCCAGHQTQDMPSQYPTSPAYANMPGSYDGAGQSGGRALSWSSTSNLSPLAMSSMGSNLPGSSSFSDRQLPMPSPARMPGISNGGTSLHNSMPYRTSVNWNNSAFAQNAQNDPNSTIPPEQVYAARRASSTQTSPTSTNAAHGKDGMNYMTLQQGNNDQVRRDPSFSWSAEYATGSSDTETKSVRLQPGYNMYGSDSSHRDIAYGTAQNDSNNAASTTTVAGSRRKPRGSM